MPVDLVLIKPDLELFQTNKIKNSAFGSVKLGLALNAKNISIQTKIFVFNNITVINTHETCGYEDKYTELSRKIKAAHPEVSVTPKHGWPGSFEVYINGVEVHSRLKTLAFPDFENVVEIVKEVESGMAPKQVEKLQPIFGF